MKIPRLLIACNESSLKCIHYIVSNMFNSKIVQTKNEEFVIPVQRIRSRGTNSFSSACFCDLDAAIVYYGIGRRGGEADSVAWHPIDRSIAFPPQECLFAVCRRRSTSDFIERKSNFFRRRQLDLPNRKEDRRSPYTGTGRSQHLESLTDLWTPMFSEISLKIK